MRARSTASKDSPACTARSSTDCRATRDTVTLVREPWRVPADVCRSATSTIVPLRAGESVRWRVDARAPQRAATELAPRAILAVRSQPDRRCLGSDPGGEESPGSTEQDAG